VITNRGKRRGRSRKREIGHGWVMGDETSSATAGFRRRCNLGCDFSTGRSRQCDLTARSHRCELEGSLLSLFSLSLSLSLSLHVWVQKWF